MGAEAPRRHGPRGCFLLLWPGWCARPHHLWQCTVPAYGNYAAPETFYRVGADLTTTFNFEIGLPYRPPTAVHSILHHEADDCSNGSNFLITGWRYAPNLSKLVPLCNVTHTT
jgi:hypothetical protein